MPKGIPSHTVVGQRPRRQFLNKATEFFFAQLDKGFSSPYVVLSTGAFLAFLGWNVVVHYVEPNRQQSAVWRRPQSRVPLTDSHNSFWGLNTGGEGWKGIPTGRHLAETMTESAEDALRRPALVYSEEAELRDSGGGNIPPSVVCMELAEYDGEVGDDVVYRSVHYIPGIAQEDKSTTTTTTKNTANKIVKEEEGEDDDSSYLSRMPARGASMIHGMVKCRSITSLNNCVPYAGHLESEYARKMMVALGPVHILRDIAQTSFPLRFTIAKEAPVSVLVCGLHSGEIPRWMSNAFPNFQVDVVEQDGTLARICRRFMGFQESSNLRLYIADPVDFLRRTAVPEAGKRYDLIMLDAIDGAGRMSTQYGRLEFINSVRNSLCGSGCAVVSIPNRDGHFFYNIVQNWRMTFAGRTVILLHCATSPQTLLMTFQDDADRGKANFGSVANVDEFRDILRTKLVHYGPKRVPFDITGEVSSENFRVLRPGVVYSREAFLPLGHPMCGEGDYANSSAGRGSGWGAWLRRWSGAWISPGQRADLRGMR